MMLLAFLRRKAAPPSEPYPKPFGPGARCLSLSQVFRVSLVGGPRRSLGGPRRSLGGRGRQLPRTHIAPRWEETLSRAVAPLEVFPPGGRGNGCPQDGTRAGEAPGQGGLALLPPGLGILVPGLALSPGLFMASKKVCCPVPSDGTWGSERLVA